jgi:hypothetical protein
MAERVTFAWAGTLALLLAWMYLRSYRNPSGDRLTVFIRSWYDKHALPSVGGRATILVIGLGFAAVGTVLLVVAAWKTLAGAK